MDSARVTTDAIHEAAEFERYLDRVRAIAGLDDDQVQQLYEAAQDLAAHSTLTLEEAVERLRRT